MPSYDTRIPIGEPGDVCEEIAEKFGNRLRKLLELTEEVGEEFGTVMWKIDGVVKSARRIEGETSGFTQSVKGSDIDQLLREAAKEEGIDDANEFHERADWVAVVHTHPKGDPSPSGGDLLALLNHHKTLYKIESDNSRYISDKPVPTALLAVARADNGDTIITGLRIPEEKHSLIHLNAYEDQIKSYKAASMPRFFDTDEEKRKWKKNRDESYQELIHNLVDGGEYRDPVFEKCHAVIR